MPLMLDMDGKRLAKRDGSDSLGQWQNLGKSSEQLIAQFASELGLLSDKADALTAKELLVELSLDQFVSALSHHQP